MFGLRKFQNVILAVCIIALPLKAFAQSMPAGIPPSVLSQLQAMTPAQQQALAEKYGFSIPNASSMDSQESAIGMPGEQLTPRTDSLEAQTLNNELEAWYVGFEWSDALFAGNSLGTAIGISPNSPTDGDTSTLWELFYSMPVTDNITITPAIFTIADNRGAADDVDQFGALVKTTFEF